MILLKLIKKGLSFFYSYIVKRKAKKYGSSLRVNSLSFVSKTTTLGENISFNGISISGCGNVIIGNNFHSGKDCLIISQNHNFNHGEKIPYDETYICKDIIIENNVWLGDRVIVLGGITIGEGAIIQAGSVVVSNIPKYAIAGGHPAKVFSNRDVEHYKRLKLENKFH